MTGFSPGNATLSCQHRANTHEYLLKFLLVGDSDVGKDEIVDLLDDQHPPPQPSSSAASVLPKTTYILLEGKRVKLQLWDTSGQGRFSTIIRSYSRGAQGILLVYDITNRWSFDGIRRWLKEIDEHAPGVPRILVGNRLHLEFNRAVRRDEAELFAKKRNMEYFEVSTLASFNVQESLTELSRLVLTRNGMHRLWRSNHVASLQELCCRCVVQHLPTVHAIERLPIPAGLQSQVMSFANSTQLTGTLPRRGGTGYLHNHHRTISDVGPSAFRNSSGNYSISSTGSTLLRHWTNRFGAGRDQHHHHRDCCIM